MNEKELPYDVRIALIKGHILSTATLYMQIYGFTNSAVARFLRELAEAIEK